MITPIDRTRHQFMSWKQRDADIIKCFVTVIIDLLFIHKNHLKFNSMAKT